jgi:predicted TIM-barrel fold metal-dependent hydrolase
MKDTGIVDCHLHIIDHGRYPFRPGLGYTPRPDESGTREVLAATLDAHGVAHALLVQPSGYGFDNSAMLDAMAAAPGRFKAIAVISGEESDRELHALADQGVVGVRFNLVTFDPTAMAGAGMARLLARLKALDWFTQVFARDEQWQAAGPLLRQSGVKVLVDHFGIGNLAAGLGAPGFQAVLELGGSGRAAVKLSAPFRITSRPDRLGELDGHVGALLAAFGKESCVWGSDWPFLGLSHDIRYDSAMDALRQWLPDESDRDLVLRHNPARLLGFSS